MMGCMSPRAFPILFITSTRIGDAVLSSGLIRKLAQEAPNARFTIVAGPLAAPLFEHVPGLDALIVMEKRKFGGHWWRLWNQVRRREWGLVVDLRGSMISTFLSRKRRAMHRRGANDTHKVIEAARLLQVQDDPPAPFLYLDEATRARAARLCAGAELAPRPTLRSSTVTSWRVAST